MIIIKYCKGYILSLESKINIPPIKIKLNPKIIPL